MDVKALVKDIAKIHADLVTLEDGRVVTRNGCKIYLPARFSERNLASVSVETHIVGIFALVVEDKYYATMIINAMVNIDPVATNKVAIGGDEYYEFVFNPGSTVIKSTQLVKTSKLVYHIYDELIGKGRMPWYMDYEIQARIFDSARHHAGANIGQDHVVTELLVSMIARNAQDRTQYYRQVVRKYEDLKTNPPAMIPLKSVAYSATNTTNRLAGSYMKDGITSSLVSPTERTERIEALLRA